jgi:MFS transporter, DHA1 family, multidrug resistance protein
VNESSADSGAPAKTWLKATRPVAMIAFFAELGLGVINNSALPIYITHGLGLKAIILTFVMVPFFLSEVLFKSPLGVLADRWGRKPLMVAGPAISILTPLVFVAVQYPVHTVFVPFLVLFGFLRLLDGIGAAALWPAMFAYIGDHVAQEKRASAMAVLNVMYMLGLALGYLAGGWVNDTFGPVLSGEASLRSAVMRVRHAMGTDIRRNLHTHPFAGGQLHIHALTIHASKLGLLVPIDRPAHFHPSFYLGSILFALAAIVALLTLKDRATDKRQGIAEHQDPVHGEKMTWPKFVAALKTVPNLMLIAFVAFLGIGCIALLVKVFASDELGVSETDFGLLILKPAIVIAALAIPLGHLSDKFGKVQSVRAGFFVAAVGMWIMVLMYHSAGLRDIGMIAGGAFLGVGFVLAFPAWMALLTTMGSEHLRGTIIGAVSTAQGIGTLLGALIGGALYDYGSANTHAAHILPFAASATLLSLAAVMTIVLIRPQREAPLPALVEV